MSAPFTTAVFRELLDAHATARIVFQLPDGGWIPAHAHVTEVGRIDYTFLDCGGTLRKSSACRLQTWVAEDIDHRLPAGKLSSIIRRATEALDLEALPLEVEYEDGLVAQFPVETAALSGDNLVVSLGWRHTDCLAKDVCLPQAGCGEGTGCC
jgi:hypothetical protein